MTPSYITIFLSFFIVLVHSGLLFAQQSPTFIFNATRPVTNDSPVQNRISVFGQRVYHFRADSSVVHVFNATTGLRVRTFPVQPFGSRSDKVTMASGLSNRILLASGSDIQFYDTLGNHRKTLALPDQEETILSISHLNIQGSEIIISDFVNRRIVRFDTAGAFRERIDAPSTTEPLLGLGMHEQALMLHTDELVSVYAKNKPDSLISSLPIHGIAAAAIHQAVNGRFTFIQNETIKRFNVSSGFQESISLSFPGASPSICDITYDEKGNIYIADASTNLIWKYAAVQTPPTGKSSRFEFISGPTRPSIPYELVPFFDNDPEHQNSGVLTLKTNPFGSFLLFVDKNDNNLFDQGEGISTNTTRTVSIQDIKLNRFKIHSPLNGSQGRYGIQSFTYTYSDGVQESAETYRLTFDIHQWVRMVQTELDSTWVIFSGTERGASLNHMIGTLLRPNSYQAGHIKLYHSGQNKWEILSDSTFLVTPKTVIAAKLFRDQDPATSGIQGNFPKYIRLTSHEPVRFIDEVTFSSTENGGAKILPVSNPYLMDLLLGGTGFVRTGTSYGFAQFISTNGAYGGFVFNNTALNTGDASAYGSVASPLFYSALNTQSSVTIKPIARETGGPESRSGRGIQITLKQGIHVETKVVQLVELASVNERRLWIPSISHPEENRFRFNLVTRADTLGTGYSLFTWNEAFFADSLLLAKIATPFSDSISITLTTMGSFANPPQLKLGTTSGDIDLPYETPIKVPVLVASSGSSQPFEQRLRFYNGRTVSNDEKNIALPSKMAIRAFPNPFNPSTEVTVSLPAADQVSIDLFDVQGRLVYKLADRSSLSAGEHRYRLDATGLASGLYVLRAVSQSTGVLVSGKITLMK